MRIDIEDQKVFSKLFEAVTKVKLVSKLKGIASDTREIKKGDYKKTQDFHSRNIAELARL